MANPLPTGSVFGDFLVFVDESGDHGLESVSTEYPVFVLLFAIFRKDDYVDRVCRDLQRLKLMFWGHDEVVLHEHDIRKPRGDFLILRHQATRERFQHELNTFMQALPASIIAVIIDKLAYAARYTRPVNPYEYALEAGLERVYKHLVDLAQLDGTTHVVVESRGRREDADLELAFRRVCDGSNTFTRSMPLRLVMIPKTANCPGLQIADLMARPVGIRHLRPDQPNRAYDIIEQKLRRSPTGKIEGWGVKVLP